MYSRPFLSVLIKATLIGSDVSSRPVSLKTCARKMMPVSYAFYYVVLLNLVLSSAKDASDLCSGKAGIEWVHDPSECQSFYMCVNKQALKYVCPGNQVWNNRQKLCTPKGSPLDICKYYYLNKLRNHHYACPLVTLE